MALLEILTRNEQKLFDLPPQFLSADDRKNYFKLDEGLKAIVDELRGTTNKIGFILQLGYFRWAGRFFSSKYFHKKDLNFLVKNYSINWRPFEGVLSTTSIAQAITIINGAVQIKVSFLKTLRQLPIS